MVDESGVPQLGSLDDVGDSDIDLVEHTRVLLAYVRTPVPMQ